MSKSIPHGSFMGQSTILSVNFGENCTHIGDNAFKDCILLENINDNNVITTIGSSAFYNTKLSSITFNGLINMGEYAFGSCSFLNYINMDKCNIIPTYAFHDCYTLSYINIPTCFKIESAAFSNCFRLNTVKMHSTTQTEIYKGAFYNCHSLNDIYLNNCIKIEDEAFAYCTSLYKADLNNCSQIGYRAFIDCQNLSQIAISNCTEIGNEAFLNCHNLSAVYINNTPSISCSLDGNNVFKVINDNKPIINSNTLFYLNAEVYDYYTTAEYWKEYKDQMVMLPRDNQIIYQTNNNAQIEIDDKLKSEITEHKFINSRIGLITFNNDVKNLNDQIFKGKTNLSSVILPSKCETIGESEFEGCENLTDVNLTYTTTLTYIGDFAFKGCESLTTFTIPKSVNTLGEGIFAGCKNIKEFGEGTFVKYNNKAIVFENTLICVLPKNDSVSKGRIHKISEIDSNITKLGKMCFYGCEDMRRVDIPASVTQIGDNAFDGCEHLYEVHMVGFNGNLPELKDNTFGEIENRLDFKILVPIKHIDTYYNNWAGLRYKQYVYPKPENNYMIYYSSDATDNSKQYSIVQVKKGEITSNLLPSNANKTNIKTVILGEGITKINEGAFKGWTSLEYIHISDNVNKLNNECFSGCTSLKKIYIPSGITSKESGANVFYGCTNLQEFVIYYNGYLTEDNRCYIDNNFNLMFFASGGFNQSDSDIYKIPDIVKEIGSSAFRKSTVKNIQMGSSLQKIGEYAFDGCSELRSVNWDTENDISGITTISKYAFSNCTNLLEISPLPSKLKYIHEGAFQKCSKIPINTIPDSVIEIHDYAFDGCELAFSNTTKESPLTLPNIYRINKCTFRNCKKLMYIDINRDTFTIDESAFEGCEKLISVSLSLSKLEGSWYSSLSSINSKAFYGCGNLKNFNIRNKYALTNIGDYAFSYCRSYKGDCGEVLDLISEEIEYNTDGSKYSLSLPSNLQTIGVNCFEYSGITKLNTKFSQLTTIPNYAFNNCNNLTSINLSPYTTVIGDYAFLYCSNKITSLNLPDSIKRIGNGAFTKCGTPNDITLPNKLEQLGHESFLYSDVKNIIIPSGLSNPPKFVGANWGTSYPFGDPNNTSERINLKIPQEHINNYRNDIYWRIYSNWMNESGNNGSGDGNNNGSGNGNNGVTNITYINAYKSPDATYRITENGLDVLMSSTQELVPGQTIATTKKITSDFKIVISAQNNSLSVNKYLTVYTNYSGGYVNITKEPLDGKCTIPNKISNPVGAGSVTIYVEKTDSDNTDLTVEIRLD